jgi:hypothetical protein
MSVELDNKIKLCVGDYDNDGHGRYKIYSFEYNKTVPELQKGYKESVSKTGVHIVEKVCRCYEDSGIPKSLLETILKNHPSKLLQMIVDNSEEEFCELDDYASGFCEIYLEFVKMSIPDLVWKNVEEETPVIQIGGYGLFN